ncbi:cupin domain-containing protein [Rhodopseudomonas palustris]
MPKVTLPAFETDDSPHVILGSGLGPYRYQLISDPGGLTQFGAFIEELAPGSASGFRHWHETEDEMVLILSGEAVLVEDSETPLRPGDAACWPAGNPVGHRLENRSDAPVRYLVIGTRNASDVIHYTDHDLITHKEGKARRYLHRDGTPYPQGGKK